MLLDNPTAEEIVPESVPTRQLTLKNESRTATRSPASITGLVGVKESASESWKEHTIITSVSKSGAGFTLARPCPVGRLISLVSPMPMEFRSYDHDMELYPTMGVVQHCYAALEGGETVYHVGVGFIGKRSPESYKHNPCENYRIDGMDELGMWTVTPANSAFKQRKEPRYWVSIPVTLCYMRRDELSICRDATVTINIAAGGASIGTYLDVPVGDKIKLAFKEANFFTIAEVKGRRLEDGKPPSLHLEFMENRFPIATVAKARMQRSSGRRHALPPTPEESE